MRFIQLTPALSQDWDKVVFDSDDAWIFHLYDWLPLTEQVWDLEPKSFLLEHEGKIIGILPLQLNKRSKSLRSTYMGAGGAAVINGVQEGVRKKAMKSMYEHARSIARDSRSPFIEVVLSPLSNASLHNQWQVNPLVHYFYEDSSSHTWMVDLRSSKEEIFNNYSDDARRSIKNAESKGYAISQVNAVSQMDKFYEVHCETRARTGVDPHPKEFFSGFFNSYCAKGPAVIWQAKDQSGEPVAYDVIGPFKQGALYWMGCCRSEHLDSGVNYLLQHHSIMQAKAKGAQWFENGEAFPNAQEGKLRGLTVFKGKFGGDLHRFYKGTFTIGPALKGNILSRICHRLKNLT